jgi:ubiquinone/menaquinone biosynthesis C-methylase UbiE
MNSYLDEIYSYKARPLTDYPMRLVGFLIEKYNIKVNSDILDLGCGRGDFLNAFSAHKMNAYGCDYEVCNRENWWIEQCDITTEKLPYMDNTFDVVFSKSVIEHLHSPDNMMKEISRVLRPNGRVIIMTPDWHSCMNLFFDDYTHKTPYTTQGIEDLLKIYNFNTVEADKFIQLPSTWHSKTIRLLSNLIRLITSKPKTANIKNKFYRWSRELIILGSGRK